MLLVPLRCCEVTLMWCICWAGGGWHFNIVPPSREQQLSRTLLIILPQQIRCHATWMNTSWLQLCACPLTYPGEVKVPVRLLYFQVFAPLHPYFFSFICLLGTLMILKSACSYNASYIDRLISVFMRSLQKMVREHLSPQQANPGVTETSTGTHAGMY